MKKVAFHNLGCKVNSYEMDVMQQKLLEKGYEIVPFDAKADVYIVNTCTVTNIADRKSRQMLHRAKARNPRAVVVAVGCYVQTGGKQALQDPCIDLAVGNNRKKDLPEILEAYLAEAGRKAGEAQGSAGAEETEEGRKPAGAGETEEGRKPAGTGETEESREIRLRQKTLEGSNIIDINKKCEYEEMTLTHTAEHTRAYIKVQDGCNQFCSYCIIPYARGRVRSRRLEDTLEEVRGLAASGYREVVLTGIHLSSYGLDFGSNAAGAAEKEAPEETAGAAEKEVSGETGSCRNGGALDLIDLVEAVHGVEGIERIRLGSLEPRIITPENVRRLAALEKLCPHFHLSLQSGCDETLKRMNRRYTSGEYYESVKLLRGAFVHPAITTDVIVGFPGETEEEFEKTCAFLEKVGFYEMHIFKYSLRKGTRAASMPGQVPDGVKALRSDRLLSLEHEQSRAFRAYYIGKEAEVLFEEKKEEGGSQVWLGHTRDYVRVALESGEELSNCVRNVSISGFLTDEIMN